ncbi:cx9C motif-containing protein 4 [Hyperolius riggenbachi]|uniref:cx9C motif-containing protein 4 n=1 Tax=Hyperolius riggenbachi TaxID=752182 RepID=UPI0035A30724
MSQKKDPCQKAACAIQKCLQANNYKDWKCEPELQAMRICCSKLATQESVCCAGFNSTQATNTKSSGQIIK